MTDYRAAIFDMDGLLIDSEPIWRRTEIEVFGRLGLHLTEEQCLETMGVRVRQVVEMWYRRHPWEGASIDEVTQEIIDGVIHHVEVEGEPNEGVMQALETARAAGMRIAIASSSSEAMIRAVIQRLQIGDYIEAVCSADIEEHGKPHPAVFLTAARRLNVPPETCIALEDSPNGVLAARAAGMFCILVPDPHLANDPRMAQANLTLPSLAAFTPELLAGL